MPMCAREELDCPVENLKEKIAQLEKEKVELLDKCMSLDYGKSRAESWLQDTLREKAQLEREVDWLADKLARFDTCPNEMLKEDDDDCFIRCKRHMYTKPCWRAYATKAVEDASNNS